MVNVKGSNCEDVDLNLSSQYELEGGPVVVADTGTRTRSDGWILERDLRNVTGQHSPDFGIHDGADGNNTNARGPAWWTGTQWRSLVNGNVIN